MLLTIKERVLQWPGKHAHGAPETKPFEPTDQPWRRKARAQPGGRGGLPLQSTCTALDAHKQFGETSCRQWTANQWIDVDQPLRRSGVFTSS